MIEEYDEHPNEVLVSKTCHYLMKLESKSRELQWIDYMQVDTEKEREAIALGLECEISTIKYKLAQLNKYYQKFG